MKLYSLLFLPVILGHCLTTNNTILTKGVSEEDEKQIVELHNSYRSLITNNVVVDQPCGINLKQMKWDKTLAESAQKIADTTIYKHVRVADTRWAVGQNLFLNMASGYIPGTPSWGQALKSWWDEHEEYTYGKCCKNTASGHYTQMVWWNSEYVGCGYTYFCTADKSFPYRKFYICNYGPAGNLVGAKPYKTNETSG
ncbi:unnamed protein product [Ceutorhynchus assimilis]|uniref:SCP domain-containing protein n=1 Tax=Ceutorhynchus assimilis TaxID=467358 RepID=A0A9N9QHI1_9CUCU|nr:unnamed protein product [Ceutorhynchus assimilis]